MTRSFWGWNRIRSQGHRGVVHDQSDGESGPWTWDTGALARQFPVWQLDDMVKSVCRSSDSKALEQAKYDASVESAISTLTRWAEDWGLQIAAWNAAISRNPLASSRRRRWAF